MKRIRRYGLPSRFRELMVAADDVIHFKTGTELGHSSVTRRAYRQVLRLRWPARALMGTDRTGSAGDLAGRTLPAEAFRDLNRQRIDIDRHLSELAPADPARHEAWLELETVLRGMHKAVRDLANAPAATLADLKTKAAILATLLRSEVDGRGQIIAEAERSTLALSITDDIAGLEIG
jgi:hypothetical protein